MSISYQRGRFGLRLLFLCITLICVFLWWYWVRPRQIEERQRAAGQALIHERDRVYIASCFNDAVLDRLVTVLGDSRLTHWDRVHWVAYPDGETIISYGRDNALLIWNRRDGSIRSGFYDVLGAAYASDVQKVFWLDAARHMYVASISPSEIAPKRLEMPLPDVDALRFQATADGQHLIYSGRGTPVTVWAIASGERVTEIEPGEDVVPIASTPDGRGVVLANPWSVSEYKISTGLGGKKFDIPSLPNGSAASINAAAFSPDGKVFYLADAAGRVLVFDWLEERFREEFPATGGSAMDMAAGDDWLLVAGTGLRRFSWYGEPRQLFVHALMTGSVHAVAWDAGVAAAVEGGRIAVFNGDRLQRMEGGARADATCFAFSPASDVIAMAGRDGQIVVRQTRSWELVRSWKAHEGWIRRLVWSPTEDRLISVGDDVAVMWDPATGKELVKFPLWESAARSVAFDRTGSYVALEGRERDESVLILDSASFGKSRSIPRNSLGVRGDIVFSPDGTKLFAGGSQTLVNVWSLENKKVIKSMGGRSIDEVSLAISDEDEMLFVGCASDLTAFDVRTGKMMWTVRVHPSMVEDIARHPTLPFVATAGNDGTVAIVNASSGKLEERLRLGPSRGELTQVDFSPDGKLLAVAMSNGAVVVMRSMLDD